jgi:hypothetical protein
MKGLSDLINWPIGSERARRLFRGAARVVSIRLRTHLFLLSAILLFLPAAAFSEAGQDTASSSIIDQYVQAAQAHQDVLRGGSMEVQIDASVPRLKQHGRLYALRNISKVGKVTYRVLGFQGNNTVKKEVIARYLQAEQQGQGDRKLAVLPANYKFKYKGERAVNGGEDVYIFHLSPHKKRVGLFKGELWLDARTYLPVYEKGRLVKNPSIFFKKVDFERNYAIRNGVPVPQSMNSVIQTRLVGKVELNVSYSNFSAGTRTDETSPATESTDMSVVPSRPAMSAN